MWLVPNFFLKLFLSLNLQIFLNNLLRMGHPGLEGRFMSPAKNLERKTRLDAQGQTETGFIK